MKKILAFCIVFCLFSKGNSQVLTLEQAVKMGLDNSKALKVSVAKSEIASEKLSQFKASTLPSVNASAGYTRLSDLTPPTLTFPGLGTFSLFPIFVNNYATRVAVYEPIFAGFRARHTLESSQFLEKAAQLDYEKDKEEAVINIISAYYNLYKLNISKKLLEQNAEQVKHHLTDIQNMGQQGLATTNDVLKAQLQLDNIQLGKLDMENAYAVALFNFNIMIGQDNKSFQLDSAAMFRSNPLNTYESYLQKALAERPDIKAADYRTKTGDANIKIAKGAYYPLVAVAGNYYVSNPNPRIIPPEQRWVNTWDAGISLNWDLMGLYTNKHKVVEALTVQKQNQAMYDLSIDQAKMEVNQNFITNQESVQKINVAQNTIKQAEENYRVMQNRFNERVATVTDLLDANIILLQAKMNLETAKADAEVSYYKLIKSTGTLKF